MKRNKIITKNKDEFVIPFKQIFHVPKEINEQMRRKAAILIIVHGGNFRLLTYNKIYNKTYININIKIHINNNKSMTNKLLSQYPRINIPQ